MALWLNYRPDSAPPPAAMSLNAEPAAPEDREAQHLPPKSYAAAAEEALEPQSHVNGTDGAAGSNAQPNNGETDASKTNGVGILRIVDTDEGKGEDQQSMAESTKDSSKGSSKESSIKDQESYEGTGIDETPKSPKAKSHRRKGSRSSLGSVGRTYGVSIKNDLKNAVDGNNEQHEKHEQQEEHTDNLLHEKPRLSNGDALTTVKPPMELEKTNRTDKLKRRNSELKAGRQAGAGWATSKYVHLQCPVANARC
jgi:hypothetical protein